MKTNTSRPPKDGDCAYVDQVTLANWLYRPCTDSDGVAACEMTMRKFVGNAHYSHCMHSTADVVAFQRNAELLLGRHIHRVGRVILPIAVVLTRVISAFFRLYAKRMGRLCEACDYGLHGRRRGCVTDWPHVAVMLGSLHVLHRMHVVRLQSHHTRMPNPRRCEQCDDMLVYRRSSWPVAALRYCSWVSLWLKFF